MRFLIFGIIYALSSILFMEYWNCVVLPAINGKIDIISSGLLLLPWFILISKES